MNKKFVLLILFILTLILTLFFIDPNKQTQTILIVDADTVVANQANFYHKELRVRGFVKPGSIVRMGNKAEFIVVHNNKELPVYFNGKTQIPDTFGDAAPVRIDGTLNPNGTFTATKIEAKCASKYEAPNMKINHDQLQYRDYNKL
ncbi:MAG: cytochrome c maturation protein CcmE [Leptospiraceae bacterium]|jgi:cytochrome c-type biogenesis protein CcmE|nr:cytochrome c maturation protein CcmE [Leptospiraceae bacterium]